MSVSNDLSPRFNRRHRWLWIGLLGLAFSGLATAQRWRRNWSGGSIPRGGVPTWEVDKDFPNDLFTFVRVKYDSFSSFGYTGGGWMTDFPDSDLNFSLRLQQLTSLQVNPEPIILELTDDRILDFPFIYIIEPGALSFTRDEVDALRRYCLNGGFLMVDDFWGDTQYENMRRELKRVFPDRDPFEVSLDHEIFHCVYDLKEKPQVPAINSAYPMGDGRWVTWEQTWDGSDTRTPHYKAIADDTGRIMVFLCHNTDLGDGWEREGFREDYFREFSVKKSYPMGINIVTYAMTH